MQENAMAGNSAPTRVEHPDLRNRNARRRNPWSIALWSSAACLLLVPWVAMQFTREVDWGVADFLVMGALLAVVCALYELATWLSDNTAYRLGFAVAIVTAFLTIWVNLAVGMLGSEHNPANLLFGGVLLVAAVGALAGKFGAQGMARAMQAAALAQVAMAAYAFFGGYRDVVLHISVFAIAWLASAQLFRRAAREQARAQHAR
jgi:hypothetical protein